MKKVKLGDYVKIRTGKLDANASSPNGEYPFFTCSQIPLKIDKYSYDCECVLVAGNGDLNVKFYYGKFDAYQRTYIIESLDKKKLDTRYLYCFMNKYIERLRKQTIGGIIKYIKLENLTNIQILLPSVSEQERIAKELDVVCGAMEKQKKQLELCDTLIKSKFNEMFGTLSSNETLKNVCKFINGDRSSNYPKVDDYLSKGIPFINAGDIQNGCLTDIKFHYIKQSAFDRLSSGKVQLGDIIYCLRGSLGKHCIVDIERGAIASSLVILRLDSTKILSEYLNELLNSQMIKKQMISSNNGSSQPNLSAESVKGYKIPLPPLPLQQKFADFVNEVEQNKAKIKQSLNETETLYKALMQKYFDKGEV